MPTTLHFIDVGEGNMTLIIAADGTKLLYDCNVTTDNNERVLGYLTNVLGGGQPIDVFINSHRDADHMRGVKMIHAKFPIKKIWDSGVTGNTPNSSEYRAYMDLRRTVGDMVVKRRTKYTYGNTILRIFNAKNDDLPNDPNAQSIVIKVQHTDGYNTDLGSALLTGDTNAPAWNKSIVRDYGQIDLKSDILLASHHGSISFFDDPGDEKYYYEFHAKLISPELTIISVGPNSYGHPDPKAIELYEKYTKGSKQGNKTFRTDLKGTMKLTLKDESGWELSPNQ